MMVGGEKSRRGQGVEYKGKAGLGRKKGTKRSRQPHGGCNRTDCGPTDAPSDLVLCANLLAQRSLTSREAVQSPPKTAVEVAPHSG